MQNVHNISHYINMSFITQLSGKGTFTIDGPFGTKGTIKGSSALNETVHFNKFAYGARLDANIDRIELPYELKSTSYHFKVVSGLGLCISEGAGGNLVAIIPSLNQTTTLSFTNGSALLKQVSASTFTLGGAIIDSSGKSFAPSNISGFNTSDTSNKAYIQGLGSNVGLNTQYDSSLTFDATDNNTSINGASGNIYDVVRIEKGVSGTKIGASMNKIIFTEPVASYKFFAVPGQGLKVIQADTGFVIATIASMNNDMTLMFSDGYSTAKQLASNNFTIGGYHVNESSSAYHTPTSLTTAQLTVKTSEGFKDISSPSTEKTDVYLANNGMFEAHKVGSHVFGSTGFETLAVQKDGKQTTFDQNIEKVVIPFNESTLSFYQQGNILNIYTGTPQSGAELLTRGPIQIDSDGTQIRFTNGTAYAKIDAHGIMTLGGIAVSNVAPATVNYPLIFNDAQVPVTITGQIDINAPIW